uniref:Telomere length regulation protein TEL2 homolog n=1 Tax=Panagrolaimus sp. JU765 TaxID=591449 RepID=A0AC34Q1M5_9BILA
MFGNLLKKNYKNETDEDEQELNLTDEEKEKLQFNEEKRREHISLYPIIVTFCLKIVQLDNHSDIRGIYLPQLLNAIMFTIKKHGCDSFGRDNLIALIAVCRQILIEINQNIITTIETGVDVDDDKTDDGKFKLSAKNSSARKKQQIDVDVDDDKTDDGKFKLSAKNSSARKKQQIDEQTKIENCLESCQELLIHVCEWYTKNRDRDKAGILLSMTTLLRDFSEFPFYCYDTDDSNKFLGLENLIPIMPTWMKSLQQVIDVSTWQISINDFDVRSKIVDLIICLYIRSLSLIEQHMASIGKDTFDYMKMATITTTAENKPSTTTLLFKPMLTEENLRSIDESKIFENVSKVLWNTLAMNTLANDHQMASFLLHRLHSRNINDMSSDVETIILNDLTTMDKDKSSEACRRFKKLWTLTRGSTHDNVYFGVPYKSFNRVIMVLLGQIGDDTKKNSSLKTLATSWFIDCAKHGDLPRILQMLGTMLLNPSTARVSIQYMQIQNRITNEQVKSMPKDINSLTLLTANGKQSFHHVCRDVSLIKNGTNSSVNCTTNAAWISDLKKYLLIPSLNTEQTFGFSPTLISASSSTTTTTTTPAAIKTHKRTISDIPQFDDEEIENESIGDYLYDSNIDPDVVDCLMNVIDNVIEHLEQEEHFDEVYQSIIDSNIKDEFVITGNFKNNDRRSLPANFDIPRKNDKREEQSKSLLIENNDKDDIKENINGIMKEPIIEKNIIHTPPQQPIIKRVKTGHRRQDSLQESIFSSGEKELRLFDPAELPTLTAPGDAKQPLLEEAQAHMLLYMESPSCVDLGRIQGVFKTLSLLMRTNKGASLGRMMVHCMAFNQTSILPQTITGSPCQLVEYLTRHYKAIQGEGFCSGEKELRLFDPAELPTLTAPGDAKQPLLEEAQAHMLLYMESPIEYLTRHYKAIQGEGFWYDLNGQNDSTKGRHCSFLELFCTVSLYYLRSYFLNSPISPISETELTTAWECKIAALDFFTDLLRELIALITDTKSREFVNFILQIYRSTKLQRCLISFLLTAVPVSRNINEA